jgi:hypothetical protein
MSSGELPNSAHHITSFRGLFYKVQLLEITSPMLMISFEGKLFSNFPCTEPFEVLVLSHSKCSSPKSLSPLYINTYLGLIIRTRQAYYLFSIKPALLITMDKI